MSRYSEMFSRLREAGEGAFVPFVMLGDPTPELSEEVVITKIGRASCRERV